MNTQLKRIDYLPFLESCWEEHLKPKQDDAPTVISTFAGCGGSSLGYSMAGFKELLAVELDNNAVETFKLNFHEIPVYHGDICKLSIEQVFETTGLKEGQLDILDGSPPCQGFSIAGKRQIDDDRNQLFRQYVRLLKGLKPKVFVMENVSGMVKGVMKFLFVEILNELKSCGYKVSVRLLNAMYFNVPQSRERMIFIGVREDIGIEPSHPIAENIPICVKEAIKNADISGTPNFNDKYSKIYDKIKQGQKASHIINKGFNNCVKINPLKPCCTLPKLQTGHGFATIVHYNEKRGLSVGEGKRISSFPDAFQFIGKYKDKWARIGNSVPPLFMRSIALHIKNNILNKL